MSWLTKILGYIFLTKQEIENDWQNIKETSLSNQELTQTLIPSSIPSVNFYSLLALATVIATCGLLANNAVTIIGAMIVAPLMNPIVSLSYALINFNSYLLKRSIFTLITGILLVLILSFGSTHLLATRVVSYQILARIEPNLLDLGVAIASGAAAGLAYARKNISNSLPGVAIAVALVPPLCVTGIALALRQEAIVDIGLYFGRTFKELNLAGGSFLLFLTNLAGIIFCAGLIFLIQGYGNFKKAIIPSLITIVVLVILSLPLTSQLESFLLRNQVVEKIDSFSRIYIEQKGWIENTTGTVDLYVENRDTEIYVLMTIVTPRGEINQENVDILQEFLSQELKKPINLELHLVPFDLLKKEPN